MNAKQFNQLYPIGTLFIHHPGVNQRELHKMYGGGKPCKTVATARDLPSSTVVEINHEPWFANIEALTPVT